MKFSVRVREVLFYEVFVEADSYQEASSIAVEQVSEQLTPEGFNYVRYEIENVCVMVNS